MTRPGHQHLGTPPHDVAVREPQRPTLGLRHPTRTPLPPRHPPVQSPATGHHRAVPTRAPGLPSQPPAGGCQVRVTGHRGDPGDGQALPKIRFILVPHTGQVPLAIRRPLDSAMSPSKSRFSLHFTQYPL